MTTIKIPIRLTSEANSSEHWAKSAKRHKQQRFLTAAFLKQASLPQLPWRILLTRFSPRPFDEEDNLRTAFKYIKDAIAQFVLGGRPGQKDSDKRLHWNYAWQQTKDAEHFITIEILPLSIL